MEDQKEEVFLELLGKFSEQIRASGATAESLEMMIPKLLLIKAHKQRVLKPIQIVIEHRGKTIDRLVAECEEQLQALERRQTRDTIDVDAVSSSGVLGVACKAWDLTVGSLGISMGSLDTLAGWLNVLRLNWTINSTGFGGVSDFPA